MTHDQGRFLLALVSRGIITDLQRQRVITMRESFNNRISELKCLLDLKFASPLVLAQAIAEFYQLPFESIQQVQLNDSLGQLIPIEVAERWRMIALRKVVENGQNLLVIGVAMPLTDPAKDWLSTALRISTMAVIVPADELERKIGELRVIRHGITIEHDPREKMEVIRRTVCDDSDQSWETVDLGTDATAREDTILGLDVPDLTRTRECCLTVLVGPRKGSVYRFEQQGEFIIGRDADAAVRMNDKLVSRRHAKIVSDETGIRVVDLKSMNGIRLNGESIGEAPLNQGDKLQVGETLFEVSIVDSPA